MSAEPPATEQGELQRPGSSGYPGSGLAAAANDDVREASLEDDEDAEGEEEDDEEDEAALKYAKLTGSLTNLYRNGDSTSTFAVVGDKIVMGTHNGNVHVLSLPTLRTLRTYHAHSATITSISVSPKPPPPGVQKSEESVFSIRSPSASVKSQQVQSASSPRTPRSIQQQVVPNTVSNQIYIATSSLDGHACISSLVDAKDVQLRNFARPLQAVALSPDYKNDRTYLSGGLAGSLILTVGGVAGVSTDANTNSAAAAASGWLGSIGLGADRGKDTALHSGEGAISTIMWSLSGKWVVWVNEEGIKIMRSHLKLGSEASEDAWRRIAHAARPNRTAWEDMAGVWRGRAVWIDERKLEIDKDDHFDGDGVPQSVNGVNGTIPGTPTTPQRKPKKAERLVVGWGDTAWVLDVKEGGKDPRGKKLVGSADIVHKLQFRDCIVSGISLYTPSLLAILAYRTRDDDDVPLQQQTPSDGSKKGRHHRQNGLPPQLRLVHMVTGEEVEVDDLPISRSEMLSVQDYHLDTLWMPPQIIQKPSEKEQRGALEGLWDVAGGKYATRMFASSASVLSHGSSGKDEKSSFASPPSSTIGVAPPMGGKGADAHPFVAESGLKVFIQSPFDCVLAIKRNLSDHLEWLLEHQRYGEAWELIDKHPEVIDTSTVDKQSTSSQPSTPSRANGSLAEFFADEQSEAGPTEFRAYNSIAQKEKRRIGDLWLLQLTTAGRWAEAGKITGKVLGSSTRWEHWVWTFAQEKKFDEITPYIPSTRLIPPLPSLVYEVVLGHYVVADPPRLKGLLDEWDPELFDPSSVVTAIESRLESGDVTEDTTEHEVQGHDWRILVEALAKLYLATGRAKDALKCYIRAQNADRAMELIKEEKLIDAVAEDIPGFLMLRVTKQQLQDAPIEELDAASSDAIQVLVDEAHSGAIMPSTTIRQIQGIGRTWRLFLFFYFRALWRGTKKDDTHARSMFSPKRQEGHALVEDHADLAVEVFADYDQKLLLEFLETSSVYSYDKAATICESRHYIPELVYVLAKMGQTKRALLFIIEELGDVSKAIGFARENPDLWDDLLDYSMGKPSLIRGLLEEVGTSIDPIALIRRIPEGLEIEGLREGLAKMMREYDIQYSISEGVARVLRGEVQMGMDTLRAGQKKAVRFEVVHSGPEVVDIKAEDPPTVVEGGEALPVPERKVSKQASKEVKPGHCVGCGEAFQEHEREPLLGFACGHVYHLSCLLKSNPETSDSRNIARLLRQLGVGDDEEDAYTGRSVGAKVAHAHIIKNVVQGGCRHCVIPEGA